MSATISHTLGRPYDMHKCRLIFFLYTLSEWVGPSAGGLLCAKRDVVSRNGDTTTGGGIISTRAGRYREINSQCSVRAHTHT